MSGPPVRKETKDNPYVSPANYETSPANRMGIFANSSLVVLAVVLIVATVVIHRMSFELRDSILVYCALGIIPTVLVLSFLPRRLDWSAIIVCLFGICLFLRYCDDMGGDYAHSIVAGMVGAASILGLVLSSIILFAKRMLISMFMHRNSRAK